MKTDDGMAINCNGLASPMTAAGKVGGESEWWEISGSFSEKRRKLSVRTATFPEPVRRRRGADDDKKQKIWNIHTDTALKFTYQRLTSFPMNQRRREKQTSPRTSLRIPPENIAMNAIPSCSIWYLRLFDLPTVHLFYVQLTFFFNNWKKTLVSRL